MKRDLSWAVVFAILVFAFGCKDDVVEEWPIDAGKYVFIEHSINTHGSLLQTPYENNGPHLEFPTYSYDAATKVLTGIINFDVTDDIKVVFGNSKSITGFAGSGTASGLTGLNRIPYIYEKFEIAKIDADGTAVIKYNDEEIELKSGEVWSVTSADSIVTQEHGDRTGKIKVTVTDKITNFGIWDKKNIIDEWSDN